MGAEQSVNSRNSFLYSGVVILSVAIVAVLLGAAYFFRGQNSRETELYRNNLVSSGKEAYRRGQIDEAIQKLEEAATTAKSSNDEATAKWNLARAQNVSSQGFLQSLSLYKEMVANKEYSTQIRAGAMVKILSFYATRDYDLARTHIFSGGQFWEKFNENGNIEEAVRRAYEESLVMRPDLVTPHYQIALWYGERLLESKNIQTLTNEQKSFYAEQFQDYLVKGDALLAGVFLQPLLETWEKAFIVGLRGNAYALAYILNGKAQDGKIAEQMFVQANDLTETMKEEGYKDSSQSVVRLFLKYDYARFLAYLVVEKKQGSYQAELKKNLDGILSETNKSLLFFQLLRNVGKLPKNHALRQLTIMIVKADPRFGNLLRELDWKV